MFPFAARSRIPSLFRSRLAIWGAGACLLLVCVAFLPVSWFDSRGQVAIEAARVVLALALLLFWLGWTFSALLLPRGWKQYEPLLIPLVGVAVFMPAAYLLNFVVDMKVATALLFLLPLPLGVWRLLRGAPVEFRREEILVPAVSALGLLAAALLQQVVQGSLGPLAYNGDEEGYFGVASYMLAYPAGAGTFGPPAPVFGHLIVWFRAEGWGFYYLIAAASAASGVHTFSTYLPAVYILLAASVLTWYIFFREVLRLSRRWAYVAVVLYALNGLPLWFAVYGYGRQIAWLALTPLLLSALALAIRGRCIRPVLFAGLVMGAFLMTETRLGVVLLATVVAGLAIYWLAADRSQFFVQRLLAVGLIAAVVAAPVLWYFVQGYLASGAAFTMFELQPSDVVVNGPNVARFFPLQEVLGLEPTELARMREPIPLLSWLDPLDQAMIALAPYLAWLLVLMAAVGVVRVARRNPVALALTAGFFLWVAATALLLRFPYGYFKLFSVGGPLVLGFAASGAAWLRSPQAMRWLSGGRHRTVRRAVVLSCILLGIFMVRNSAFSVLFGARGWGLSIPPAVVRGMVSLGQATEPGSRVYLSGFAEYPLPDDAYVIRKEHRLAMQSEEETRLVWADRVRTILASNLLGRELYGVFKTRVREWTTIRHGDDYDYYILSEDEDPRIRGLDSTDLVAASEHLVLYRSPGGARASSEQILSARGTLRVDAADPLAFSAGLGSVSFAPAKDSHHTAGMGRVRVAFLALKETTARVSAGDFGRTLALDPGLSWYTTPDLRLPADFQVSTASSEPLRVVALRALPPGEEELDRCNEAILSSEVVVDGDAVNLELWYSNPMKDAKGASASIDVRGLKSVEQDLALAVPDSGERWLLRFPLKGGGPQQLRDGVESVPMKQVPWLENGGGMLLFRFNLGHERPREFPLASAVIEGGRLVRLDRYVDPVQLRLWGYYHRYERATIPDLHALENTLVRTDGGLTYAIVGGFRHWIPDPEMATGYGPAKVLRPEELWLIPPGPPLDSP